MTINEIIQHYDAKDVEIIEPSIIININRQYTSSMDGETQLAKDTLYNVTRSSWKVGPKKDQAQYAVAAYRGLVREIYEIKGWNSINNRWEFSGDIAPTSIRDKYLNQSIKRYIKKGNQNPIKYTY